MTTSVGDGESQVTIQDLFKAVVTLGERVSALTESLTAVNQLQMEQIPREEHERRWRSEQQELITLRLHIRRRTYIVGSVFFLLSLVALGVTTALVQHQQNADNQIQKTACETRVANAQQSVVAYGRLLESPTIRHDGTLKAFIQTAYEFSERGTHVKC